MKTFSDRGLETLLDDIESDRVEKKSSLKGDAPRKIQEAICAFANDLPNHNRPGVIFVGANDDGTPSDLPITENLLNTLYNFKTNGKILSLPTMTVEKRSLKGGVMAVITVMPSDVPPVKYDGRIWVRGGARRAIANEQEERMLAEKRKYKDIPYDLYPVPTAKLDDLEGYFFTLKYLPAAFAPDIIEKNERSYEEKLASCKMIVSIDDPTPTVLGLLTTGKEPHKFIHGAYVQFLRIAGTALSDPVTDALEVTGTFTDILDRCENKLMAYNFKAYDFKALGPHTINSDYPDEAVKQILYNAVLHRAYDGTNAPIHFYWYDDRIEVTNPGAPYGGITAEEFGEPGRVAYRNLNIADVLKNLGYIERFGAGISLARSAMKKNGNPPLEFKVTTNFVTCILRKKEK